MCTFTQIHVDNIIGSEARSLTSYISGRVRGVYGYIKWVETTIGEAKSINQSLHQVHVLCEAVQQQT